MDFHQWAVGSSPSVTSSRQIGTSVINMNVFEIASKQGDYTVPFKAWSGSLVTLNVSSERYFVLYKRQTDPVQLDLFKHVQRYANTPRQSSSSNQTSLLLQRRERCEDP